MVKSSDKPVTEEKLKKILVEYPTKKDLKKEISGLKDWVHDGFEDVVEKLGEQTKDLRNEMMANFEKVFARLDNLEQENEVGMFQTAEIRTKVDDHDKRINKLEARKN